jgi:hypothetical protein
LLLKRRKALVAPTPPGLFFSHSLKSLAREIAPETRTPRASAFAHKLAGANALLRAQPRRQHRVETSQTHSVRIVARVVANLPATRDADNFEAAIARHSLFQHFLNLHLVLIGTFAKPCYVEVTGRLNGV